MRRADNVFLPLGYEPATTTAHGVAYGLADAYAELVDVELPDALASLVLLLQEREASIWKHVSARRASPLPTRVVIVVEDDPTVRELAVAMLEETVLDVVACASAEEALGVLGEHADSVAMLFTDVQLAGAMDGVQLACLASRNWPNVRLVVTSGGAGNLAAGLPGEAVYLDKPWRALDVLVQVDQAVRQPGPVAPR